MSETLADAQDPMMALAMELNAKGLNKATGKPNGEESARPVEEAKPDTAAKRAEDGKFQKSEATVQKEESAKREQWNHAMRRAQLPQELIDSMTPEQFAATGQKLFESQGKIDKALREKGVKQSDETPVADPSKDGTPQKIGTDLKAKVDAAKLADRLALEGAELKEVESWGTELVKPWIEASAAKDAELAEYRGEIHATARHLGIALLPADLQPFVAEFREQIEAKYDEYAEGDAYDNYEITEGARLCALDAVKFVCAPQIAARNKAKSEADAKAKSAGQPSTGSRQGDGALAQADPWMRTAEILTAKPGAWQEAQRAVYG